MKEVPDLSGDKKLQVVDMRYGSYGGGAAAPGAIFKKFVAMWLLIVAVAVLLAVFLLPEQDAAARSVIEADNSSSSSQTNLSYNFPASYGQEKSFVSPHGSSFPVSVSMERSRRNAAREDALHSA